MIMGASIASVGVNPCRVSTPITVSMCCTMRSMPSEPLTNCASNAGWATKTAWL